MTQPEFAKFVQDEKCGPAHEGHWGHAAMMARNWLRGGRVIRVATAWRDAEAFADHLVNRLTRR